MRERGIYTLLTLIPNSYSLAGKRHTTYWLDKRAERILDYITRWARNVSKQAIIRALILFYILTAGRAVYGEVLYHNAYSLWEHELRKFLESYRNRRAMFLLTSPFVSTVVFGIGKNTIIIPARRADPDFLIGVNPVSDNAMYWIGNYPWLHRMQLFYIVFIRGRKAVLKAVPVKFKYMRLADYLVCKGFSKKMCHKIQFEQRTFFKAEDFANATQTIVKLLSSRTLIRRGEVAILVGQSWLPDLKAGLRWETQILKKYAEDLAWRWLKDHYQPMKLLYKAEVPTEAVEQICTNERCKRIMYRYLSLYSWIFSKGKIRIVPPWELPQKLKRKLLVRQKNEEQNRKPKKARRHKLSGELKKKFEEFSHGLDMLKKSLEEYGKKRG